jgi:hypothetical protein
MNGDVLKDIVRKFKAVEGRFERHLLGWFKVMNCVLIVGI